MKGISANSVRRGAMCAIAAFVLAAPDGASADPAGGVNPRIIGDNKAAPGEYPWQIGILFADNADPFYCGGSLIAPDWVLTAAPCLDFMTADEIQVLIEPNSLVSGGRRRDMTDIVVHPDRRPNTSDPITGWGDPKKGSGARFSTELTAAESPVVPRSARHAPSSYVGDVAKKPPAAEAAAEPAALAVLDIRLLDTSDPDGVRAAEHAARLAATTAQLRSELAGDDTFRIVPIDAAELAQACPETADDACFLAAARAAGADLLLLGVVQKSSNLVLTFYAHVVDIASTRVVFSRDLSFRGDTDEAWRRATSYLATDLKAEPPDPS
jgi:hypothetical protein